MTIDTGAFIAGVAVLVSLDVASIALTFETYKRANEPDERTQETAQEAAKKADRAHLRLDHRAEDAEDGERMSP